MYSILPQVWPREGSSKIYLHYRPAKRKLHHDILHYHRTRRC